MYESVFNIPGSEWVVTCSILQFVLIPLTDTPSFPLEDGNLDLTWPLLFYDFISTQLLVTVILPFFFFGDVFILLFFYFFLFLFLFLGRLLWHVEIPGLGVKSGAGAVSLHHNHSNARSSCICDLCCSLQQPWKLNPLE